MGGGTERLNVTLRVRPEVDSSIEGARDNGEFAREAVLKFDLRA